MSKGKRYILVEAEVVEELCKDYKQLMPARCESFDQGFHEEAKPTAFDKLYRTLVEYKAKHHLGQLATQKSLSGNTVGPLLRVLEQHHEDEHVVTQLLVNDKKRTVFYMPMRACPMPNPPASGGVVLSVEHESLVGVMLSDDNTEKKYKAIAGQNSVELNQAYVTYQRNTADKHLESPWPDLVFDAYWNGAADMKYILENKEKKDEPATPA